MTTLKERLQELGAGIGVMLGVYVVFVFSKTFSSSVYWLTVCLLYLATMGGTIALARISGKDESPLNYLLIATAAFLALSCLGLSPHAADVSAIAGTAAVIALTAPPLGVGAIRSLIDPWRSLSWKAIVVGCVAGVLGWVLGLFAFRALEAGLGLRPFIPLIEVPVVDLLGFDILPLDWGNALRRSLVGDSPAPAGAGFILVLLVQGLQSTAAALWDTLLLALFTLVVAVPAKGLFLRRL